MWGTGGREAKWQSAACSQQDLRNQVASIPARAELVMVFWQGSHLHWLPGPSSWSANAGLLAYAVLHHITLGQECLDLFIKLFLWPKHNDAAASHVSEPSWKNHPLPLVESSDDRNPS